MRFGKLFRYDLRSGFTSCIFRLAAIVVLVLVSCAEMYFRKHTVYRRERYCCSAWLPGSP